MTNDQTERFFTLRPRLAGKATDRAAAAMEKKLQTEISIDYAEDFVQRALLDSILYGYGMWQQDPFKAAHIDPCTIWKPNTPDEVDAFVEALIRDDIDTHFRGTWRLTRLATALRAAYQ